VILTVIILNTKDIAIMKYYITAILYIPEGIFDGSCTSTIGDTTCLYSLKCTGDKCQCVNPATQFFDGTAKLCKTSKH